MTVKLQLADGTKEFFNTENYKFSTLEDMHPMIVKAAIFAEGKKIFSFCRPFPWIYRHFTFKSKKVQNKLKVILHNQKTEEK